MGRSILHCPGTSYGVGNFVGDSPKDCPYGRIEVMHGCMGCPVLTINEIYLQHPELVSPLSVDALKNQLRQREVKHPTKRGAVVLQHIRDLEADLVRIRSWNEKQME